MTVYVYKYAGQGPKPFTAAWPHPWFGLTADTEEELHPFAGELGLTVSSAGRAKPDQRCCRWSDITIWTRESATAP